MTADVKDLIAVTGTGLPVLTRPGTKERAFAIGARAAAAHRWLSALIGFTPEVTVGAIGPQHWAAVTDFPVYGFPHFVDESLLLVGSEPSPFFDGMLSMAAQTSPLHGDLVRETYGDPPDSTLFSDLLVIHELGHLYHSQAGFWFPQRWLSELFTNLALEGWVRDHEAEALPLLRTLPRCFRDIDTSGFPMTRLDRMEASLEAGPQGPTIYAWYQTVLEVAATAIWDQTGLAVLPNLHRRFREGRPIPSLRTALVDDIHPVFGTLIDNWPTWPALDQLKDVADSPVLQPGPRP